MTDAYEYGKALFLITEEDAVSEKVLADVKTAESVFIANPDYVKLLCSPAVPKEERVELVGKALSGLDTRLLNLIKILTEMRAVNLFDKACAAASMVAPVVITSSTSTTTLPLARGDAAKTAAICMRSRRFCRCCAGVLAPRTSMSGAKGMPVAAETWAAMVSA